MEIDDDRLDRLIAEFADRPQPQSIDRSFYFKELFRLQGELVKVQDWVVDQTRSSSWWGSSKVGMPPAKEAPSNA